MSVPEMAARHTPGRRGWLRTARTALMALVLQAAVALALAVAPASPSWAASETKSILSVNQVLGPGQELVSVGGQYKLIMQDDGNLVVYGNGCVVWASGTADVGANDYLVMQGDGNLVIYTGARKPIWASNTAGTGTANYLNMQADGNLVVYTSAGRPVWAAGRAQAARLCAPDSMGRDQYLLSVNGQYRLLMQDDGNLVLYGPGGAAWASGTAGSGGTSLNMQADGNLVIYTASGKPVWASGTSGTGSGGELILQDDGTLILRTGSGTVVWSAGPAMTGKTASRNLGDPGQCTWWADNEFHAYSGLYPYIVGNADNWASSAAANGWTVTAAARVDSIAVFPPGVNGASSLGHVAWVTGISGSKITISEMNGTAGPGKVDTRTLTPASSVRYILAP